MFTIWRALPDSLRPFGRGQMLRLGWIKQECKWITVYDFVFAFMLRIMRKTQLLSQKQISRGLFFSSQHVVLIWDVSGNAHDSWCCDVALHVTVESELEGSGRSRSFSLSPENHFPAQEKRFPSESLHCLLIILQRKAPSTGRGTSAKQMKIYIAAL